MKHSFGTWVMRLLISVIVVLTGNIPGFDVREFYVELVHQLKNRGF